MENILKTGFMGLTALVIGCGAPNQNIRNNTDWQEGITCDKNECISTACARGYDTSAARTLAAHRARHNYARHKHKETGNLPPRYNMDLHGSRAKKYHKNSDGSWCTRIKIPQRK